LRRQFSGLGSYTKASSSENMTSMRYPKALESGVSKVDGRGDSGGVRDAMRTEENPQCHPRDPRVIRVQWIVHKVHDGAHQAKERELGLLTNTHGAERAGRIGVDQKRSWCGVAHRIPQLFSGPLR
jgi:hypothetical protein